jgi:DNA-binding CsgD family transcriptional regulator/tetratricopeptide (TPR) repeat protein
VDRLIERESELAALVEVVEMARAGMGSFVLIAGEAGIGKTSLLRALRARLEGLATFVVGACEALSVPVPLGPVRELFAGAGDDGVLPDGGDRFALARSLLDALDPPEGEPVVAVIEDAHWADPGTLDVLRLLARRVGRAGVVVVVTYRDDELVGNRPLTLLVGDLAGAPAVRRLALRRLSESGVRSLAASTGVDARELSRLTSGNPFLVVESLAARDGLPASVRDATLARVGRLEAEARGVVDAAAVVGQRVAPALLAAVARSSTEAAEEALACGVLIEDREEFVFRHELTRQAVEGSIAAPRRAALHARVLAALVGDPAQHDHARLAHHAERAGLAAEASRFGALAAAEAERVGALREAGLQLERALRFGGELDAGERFALLVRLSRALNFEGRMQEALRAANDAVALAERELDDHSRGRALNVLAAALWSLDRMVEARAAAQAAIALLERTAEVGELARAHCARLRIEAVAFEPSAVIAAAPRAIELAASAGLEEARIDAEISLGLAYGHQGRPGASAVLAAALADARDAGLHVQTIRAYVNSVMVAADAREHAIVDAVSAAALSLFDDYQAAIPRDAVVIAVARSLLDRGRWDSALEHSARGRREWFGEVPLALAVEALVHARRGESGAEALLEQAFAGVAGVPEGWRRAVLHAARAEVAWLRGDRPAVLAVVREVGGAPWFGEFGRPPGELALWAARCGERLGPPPTAPVPMLLELAGDWRGAIRTWRELQAPYEAALAALPGDDRAARAAVAALQRLGARGAAREFARARAERGSRAPRGPQRATLANAAGLTRREQEVLVHVARGETNPEIARVLHLSERTVAHHVSAILRKLGAGTRTAAVDAAHVAGVLPGDRHPPRPI